MSRNRLRRWFPGWAFGALVVLDMVANGLLGGSFDETLSERFGRMRQQGSPTGIAVCYVLELLEPDHCEAVLR